MNNYLESFYTRTDQVIKILKAANVPYKNNKEALEQTAKSWANSNLTIEQITFLLNNADKPEMEDIKTKHDLKVAMEAEPLRMGVITK